MDTSVKDVLIFSIVFEKGVKNSQPISLHLCRYAIAPAQSPPQYPTAPTTDSTSTTTTTTPLPVQPVPAQASVPVPAPVEAALPGSVHVPSIPSYNELPQEQGPFNFADNPTIPTQEVLSSSSLPPSHSTMTKPHIKQMIYQITRRPSSVNDVHQSQQQIAWVEESKKLNNSTPNLFTKSTMKPKKASVTTTTPRIHLTTQMKLTTQSIEELKAYEDYSEEISEITKSTQTELTTQMKLTTQSIEELKAYEDYSEEISEITKSTQTEVTPALTTSKELIVPESSVSTTIPPPSLDFNEVKAEIDNKGTGSKMNKFTYLPITAPVPTELPLVYLMMKATISTMRLMRLTNRQRSLIPSLLHRRHDNDVVNEDVTKLILQTDSSTISLLTETVTEQNIDDTSTLVEEKLNDQHDANNEDVNDKNNEAFNNKEKMDDQDVGSFQDITGQDYDSPNNAEVQQEIIPVIASTFMTKTESRSTTPSSVTTTSAEKREEIDNPFDYGHPSDYFDKVPTFFSQHFDYSSIHYKTHQQVWKT
ncbi:hypothetical protein DICVIV_12675 [Dictyocaulus viviparus]|uniref:Uncharacterized protein n=1 Tax=Dictyocaulus viviparus TaxID=29172 RepID=A0A0D8XCH8_DICVI|nr:hypothetical protein DICVIV_12675 [Dictyocaulus viviparus]